MIPGLRKVLPNEIEYLRDLLLGLTFSSSLLMAAICEQLTKVLNNL